MSFWGQAIGSIADTATSIFGGNKQREAQEEFAKKGIRWKVADAKAAGLHPLAALGMAGASYSPVNIVSDFAGAGQAIDRSVDATRTNEERDAASKVAYGQANQLGNLSVETARLGRDRAELENELLKTRIANERAQNPGFPSAGPSGIDGTGIQVIRPGGELARGGVQPNIVEVRPGQVTSHSSANPHQAAGVEPGHKVYRTPMGNLDLPGQELAEVLENMSSITGLGYMAASSAAKLLKGRDKPPDNLLPAGYEWIWSPWRQSWRAERK